MQEDFQTISEFIRRTDDLAYRSGLNLSEIHGSLGISKAMVFAYRSGKSRITQKVWRKLEEAEFKVKKQDEHIPQKATPSTSPNKPGIGKSAHASYAVQDDVTPYRAKPAVVDPPKANDIAEAFAKIREGLDILEALMNNTKP